MQFNESRIQSKVFQRMEPSQTSQVISTINQLPFRIISLIYRIFQNTPSQTRGEDHTYSFGGIFSSVVRLYKQIISKETPSSAKKEISINEKYEKKAKEFWANSKPIPIGDNLPSIDVCKNTIKNAKTSTDPQMQKLASQLEELYSIVEETEKMSERKIDSLEDNQNLYLAQQADKLSISSKNKKLDIDIKKIQETKVNITIEKYKSLRENLQTGSQEGVAEKFYKACLNKRKEEERTDKFNLLDN